MQIILASSNPGKVEEIQALLSHLPIQLISQSEFNVSPVEETGTTFFENAIIKARHAAQETGLPAIADDSGLVVNAIDGRPGVHSARYAGEDATDQDRINKLLTELPSSATDRSASFHCVIALMRSANDPAPIMCHGAWMGEILTKPSGDKGFGYDPIFNVPEYNCSAAELPAEIKNEISHRGKAIRELLLTLENEALVQTCRHT